MTKTFIDSANLSAKFGEAVADLKNGGDGSKLYDLAGILDSIAEVSGDAVHYALPQAIGGFGSTVMQARKALSVPYMPKELKDKLTASINKCVGEAATNVEKIGAELNNSPSDSKQMLEAIGGVHKQAHILYRELRAIVPARPAGAPEMET